MPAFQFSNEFAIKSLQHANWQGDNRRKIIGELSWIKDLEKKKPIVTKHVTLRTRLLTLPGQSIPSIARVCGHVDSDVIPRFQRVCYSCVMICTVQHSIWFLSIRSAGKMKSSRFPRNLPWNHQLSEKFVISPPGWFSSRKNVELSKKKKNIAILERHK